MINLPIILFPISIFTTQTKTISSALLSTTSCSTDAPNSLLQAAIFDFGQNLEIGLPYAAFQTERTVFEEKAMAGKGQQSELFSFLVWLG